MIRPKDTPAPGEPNRQLVHDLSVYQAELEIQNEELRHTQLELEVSRARYIDLYDHAPCGYFTLSESGVIDAANLAAASLLRLTSEDLVGRLFTAFILPEDQDTYYHHRRQLLSTGEHGACELRMLRGDAEPCWVLVEATSVKDVGGALACRAIVIDITARKRTEETLRASEARHRILFEQSKDALMTLAPPSWRFTSGNPATLALFGVADEASFLSHRLSDYSPLQQPDGARSQQQATLMFERAMATGSHFCEWTYRHFSGEECPATVLLTRIEIDGRAQLQATVRDETEVKRLQAQLFQSDRVASMGLLAAGVAHEINNPLTYVLYNLATLAETLPVLAAPNQYTALGTHGAPSPSDTLPGGLFECPTLTELAELAEEALAGVQRIRVISKAIGTFSRLETERSRVHLNDAIVSAATMAMNDIRFRAELVMDLAKLPAIWASEGKLSQVFLNLLMNAAQAIEIGDPHHNSIRVRTWTAGDDVFAEVRDTGNGISEADLPRIFEPFFTSKPIGEGSGLGLPICRKIIGEFGGDITVESKLGQGTCFAIRIPIGSHMASSTSSIPAPAVWMQGRILVVDDEPSIRAAMVRMLTPDHELITVASAEEAKAVLETDQDYDVILCDLVMPGMTGMDLHRWLIAVHPKLAQRLVFVTGGAFTPGSSEYLAHVSNRRLEKPFQLHELTRLIARVLAAARVEGAGAHAS
jgi:two-component system, cell cycle sensor histidine kinase and response regulator CckA